MQKTIEAIYAGGVFRPVEAVQGLQENQRVAATFTASSGALPLAGWRGGMSDADAKEMIQTIEAEFEKVDPDDWK